MRVESVRAIKFGDLAQVTEVVRSPLMEHLRKGDGAQLGVPGGAFAGRCGYAFQ